MLYLLKASRIREYHQQNVAILGAAEGEHVSIGYNLRWVEPGLLPTDGEGCVIVFGDSPWKSFVPVRFGVLAFVGQSGERLDLTVRLGPFVRPGFAPVLSARWATASGSLRPGREHYLFEDDNPGLATPRSLTEEENAWRTVIDNLSEDGYFDRTVFARLVSVVDDRGIPVESERPVRVGTRLHARFEMRTSRPQDEPVPVVVDCDPVCAVEVEPGLELPANGVADVVLVARTAGTAALTFRFLPEPALASRPELFVAVDPTEGADGSDTIPDQADSLRALDVRGRIRVGDLGRLVARLEREAQLIDRAWVAILDDVLLPWSPDDPSLLEALARHAYGAGEPARAVDALGKVDPRSAEGDRLLLLAAIGVGNARDLPELLEAVDLDDEEFFTHLLAALEQRPESLWKPLVNRLPHDLLGEEKTVRFLDAARRHVSTENLVLKVAEDFAYAGYSEDAAKVLIARWPVPTTCPERAVDILLELRALMSRVLPYLAHRIDVAGRLADWTKLEKLLKLASDTVDDASLHALIAAAGDRMAMADEPSVRNRGVTLLVDAARRARVANLDVALGYASRAITVAADDPSTAASAEATKLRTSLDHAIEETSVFRQYRAAGAEARDARLSRRFGGRVLHVVTGHNRAPWVDALRQRILTRDIRWHQSARDQSAETAWTAGINADRDAVLIITDRLGHDVSDSVKAACAGRRVACATSGSIGLEAVILALEQIVREPSQ